MFFKEKTHIEKFEKVLNKLNWNLYSEEDEEYKVYIFHSSYGEIETRWGLCLSKNNKYANMIRIVFSIDIEEYELENFLELINTFNMSYYNTTFYIKANPSRNCYDLFLNSYYYRSIKNFNPNSFIKLISLIEEVLKKAVPQLIKLKNDLN